MWGKGAEWLGSLKGVCSAGRRGCGSWREICHDEIVCFLLLTMELYPLHLPPRYLSGNPVCSSLAPSTTNHPSILHANRETMRARPNLSLPTPFKSPQNPQFRAHLTLHRQPPSPLRPCSWPASPSPLSAIVSSIRAPLYTFYRTVVLTNTSGPEAPV